MNWTHALDDRAKWRIRKAGDHLQSLVPLITLAAVFWSARELLGLFALSFSLNLILTHAIKITSPRRRPKGGPRSFPSGHTASAAHGAAFMWLYVSPSVGAILAGVAVFVGASRVIARKHFVVDVVAGAALGIGIAILSGGLVLRPE